MTVHPSTKAGSKDIGRKLKAHKKSRGGCGNCKLRKVKCDENKPTCKQCKDYRTVCNYNAKYPQLQSLVGGTSKFEVQILRPTICSERQTALSIINNEAIYLRSPDSSHKFASPEHPIRCEYSTGYQFTAYDLELMHNFDTRTFPTLVQLGRGNCGTIYQNAYSKLAYSHPFLMHLILTLTLNHNQHLFQPHPETKQAIAYHFSRGASLLNAKLSAPTLLLSSERDAIWVTAGLLGALSFSSLSATTPAQAWPLKPSHPSDLDWLKMTEGKKAIWKIADPMREDSIFHPHIQDFLRYQHPAPSEIYDLANLPVELRRLCGLDAASESSPQAGGRSNGSCVENPYRAPAIFLASTFTTPCTLATMGLFLSFFGAMSPAFKALLRLKDPCAMLLLAAWYAKLSEYPLWWSWRRADLEGKAVRVYLRERTQGDGENADARLDVLEVVKWLDRTLGQSVP